MPAGAAAREIRGALGATASEANLHARAQRLRTQTQALCGALLSLLFMPVRLRPRVRFLGYSLAGGEEAGSVVEELVQRDRGGGLEYWTGGE